MFDLGKVNWLGLPNFIVKREDLDDFQEFMLDQFRAFYFSNYNFGIFGQKYVSLASGFQLNYPESVCLFDDGNVGILESGNFSLDAADPVDPRIDLIQIVFTEVVDRTGFSVSNQAVDVTKKFVAQVQVKKGVAAAAPTSPNPDAGAISFCRIRVPAGSIALTIANLDHSSSSRNQAGIKKDEQVYLVENGSVGQRLKNLDFDSSVSRMFKANIHVFRKTDDFFKQAFGALVGIFNEASLEWDVFPELTSNDVGVDFSIDADGFVTLENSTLAGANYESQITISNLELTRK